MVPVTAPLVVPVANYAPHPTVTIRFRFLREGEVTPELKRLRVFRSWHDTHKLDMVFEAAGDEWSQPYTLSLTEMLAQGEWLGGAIDNTPPQLTRATFLTFTESGDYVFDIGDIFDRQLAEGNGYLAGSFPDGTTTIEGVPTSAEVRVLLRKPSGEPGDGAVVAVTESAPDGTWLVEGLNPDLRYDVVGRKDGFNDVIMANVKPEIDT